MATTAKQSSSRNPSSPKITNTSSPSSITSLSSSSLPSSSSSTSPLRKNLTQNKSVNDQRTENTEEDIETIAKQISDHAEVIYQTWKARGLAPTEILNCHSVHSNAFDKTLTPSQRNKELPTNEIMSQSPVMSNNNLKKLVNSFVTEDRARQQTNARKTNILTSGTIRDALKKFENNECSTNIKPNYVRYSSNKKPTQVAQQKVDISDKDKQNEDYEKKLINNVPDVLINTIEQKKSDSVKPKVKPETPAKPANLLKHTPSWPLKNSKKVECEKKTQVKSEVLVNGEEKNTATQSKLNEQNNSHKLMDEVLMEEERLINALKTGTVLNNDKILPEVITSTLNTPGKSVSKPNAILIKPTLNNDIKQSEVDTSAQIKFSVKPRAKNEASVPHPDISTHTVKTTNGTTIKNLTNVAATRPFLTRGSVAERVLMFEKCPEIKALRGSPRESNKLVVKPVAKPNQISTTLQRSVRGSKNIYIPRFHFPHGKPLPTIAVETTLQRLQATFSTFPNSCVSKDNFLTILKICAMPFYWRMPLYNATQLTPSGLVDGKRFCDFWKQMSVFCHDPVSRFVFILSRGQRSRPYILPEDLLTICFDVINTHPGLAFLKEASEFHSRYVHTVIARIFYSVNRSWSGKITIPELRRSDLLQVLQLLEEEEDINQIMAYFSYEHFYVIYCKFWELDSDHDLFIDQNDLARHNDHALSTRIIERIFSGCVTKSAKTNRMSYTDFVWFLLSEEDKTNPTAIEYWFRCMDLDGDGILSMYELEYFYEEQQQRMESIGIETLPFEDCLCQMLDMIKPVIPGCITLGDLKRCKMTPIFFDTFFNLEKYMEHEQRDPFASQRDQEDMTDWDRYAAQEYELLVAEEGGDTHGSYDEEEYENSIDILESHTDDNIVYGANDL